MRAADGIWAGHRDLLLQAYAAYNAQDVEALLARISDDVDWPDGAGRLHGKEQVRAHWTEQWTRTRTHDEPLSFSELDDGRAAVYIRQVVRSLDGSPISRGHFLHMHRIEGDLIRAWTSSASASCARSERASKASPVRSPNGGLVLATPRACLVPQAPQCGSTANRAKEQREPDR